jgi:hypothetical protein
MNDNIKDVVVGLMIDASVEDIEKLSIAIIKECAELNDEWDDSGKYHTFGERLRQHFGIKE